MSLRRISHLRSAMGALAGAFTLVGMVAPAGAQGSDTETLLECPLNEATAGYRALLVRDLTGATNDAESTELAIQATTLAETCIARHAVSEERIDGFTTYAFASVAQATAADMLTDNGFDVAAIDAIFDIGPGRANTTLGNLDEARLTAIFETAYAGAVEPEAIPAPVWTMFGVYLEATLDVALYTAP